jgi:hypothetical protein
MKVQDSARDVKDKYEPRALALLGKLADKIKEIGYHAEAPIDMSDDTFKWSFIASIDKDPTEDGYDYHEDDTGFYVRLEIVEKVENEGTDGDDSDFGLTFNIDAVSVGGNILGGFSPYNFTPAVWVDSRDADAVEARFELMERMDFDGSAHQMIDAMCGVCGKPVPSD